MERLLNLEQLGKRIATLDTIIMQLALRRMELAGQVGRYKLKSGEPIFRSEIEDKRIAAIRAWAEIHGLNPHFAESLLYLLINESCKQQMIQLQETVLDPSSQPETEDEWYRRLKGNLLVLTEQWSATYGEGYGHDAFATREYLNFEHGILKLVAEGLGGQGLLLDLGSATGNVSFLLEGHFDRVVGYDISQHMQTQANRVAETRGLSDKVQFECVDLEDGIPAADGSASYVVMNLGTASDLRNIDRIVEETRRVLKRRGRFFFSFYNRQALVYQGEFLPWQTSLTALVNVHRDSLDVRSTDQDGKEKVVPVFAKAYTRDEVVALFARYGFEVDLRTYPTIGAVLPNEVFADPNMQSAVTKIDETLATSTMGAYIIATGAR